MKKMWLGLAAVIVCAAGGAVDAEAQKLAPGTWTGKGVDPGGTEFPLTFEVGSSGDSLTIAMVSDGESHPLSRIRFEGNKLLFRWEADIIIDCVLSPTEGGGYEGPCTDDSGGTGVITMTPPRP